MAETNNHTPENPRKAIREARAARLRVIDGPPRTVTVYAASEAMRGSLRHANGTRFRASIDQPVEWPNDAFTARRIADGSVRTDGPGTSEPAEPDPTKNPREQAAANRPKPDQSQPKSERKPAPKEKPQETSQETPAA
jgi:hypothetical protein